MLVLIAGVFYSCDMIEKKDNKQEEEQEKVLRQVTFNGDPLTLLGEPVKEGDKAPDFKLLSKDLSEKTLHDFEGKVKVLAIYPSIDTGVCASQNRHANELFNLEDVVVLSVSCDLPFAQSRFCEAEGLENIVTLSDHRDVSFGLAYGYLIKELRLLARGLVVIDKTGIIRHVELVPELTHEPDYEKALAKVKGLLSS
ncbi:thiol peroxidase [Elysia marginata]|uniref:Peroxiredoxin-5, mitochondrial n=1 Tax=Elysia marginata TaxID=1093978 RepID=A0AAV4GP72_9GAST|nr:thiol peroxidase [Elysia marginata]